MPPQCTTDAGDRLDPMVGEADWSLRARADTYRDRRDESSRLLQRLRRSTASVTGIAGQRGAGKSSLALRVLGEHAGPDEYAQLIHAPTGYEPREFLASVFQTICENVIEHVDEELGQAEGLAERAKAEGNRLRNWNLIIGLACFLPLAGGLFYGGMVYDEFRYAGESDFAAKFHAQWPKMVLPGSIALLGYVGSLLALRPMRRMIRQARLTRREPLKVGLRMNALEHLEHLRFQTSEATTKEAGLSLGSLASKMNTSRNLSARPLSVPGLTAQLRRFLERIGEAYPGRVVLCLDELDKIEDPRDLDRLLRGLKGVLGQHGTHFLLTVSEDALARFASRGRGGRDMVESAFEDIIFLDRVDEKMAGYLVAGMCSEEVRDEERGTVQAVVLLLWMFGGGVPREIKRHALICLEADVVPTRAEPIIVWRQLFRTRLDEMALWAARVGGEDESTFSFLSALEQSELFWLDDASDNLASAVSWGKEFVSGWTAYLEKVQAEPEQENARGSEFARAAVEIVIGGSAVAFALEEEGKIRWDEPVRVLRRIFEVLPSNVRFGRKLVGAYLESVGMGGHTEVKEVG